MSVNFITNADKGANAFTPTTQTEVGSMAGKIAEQVIRDVEASDKLAIFDKMPVQNGDTIEQVVIKMAESSSYDSAGSGALSRVTPAMAVKYFNKWTRAKYKTTVDNSIIRKVLDTGKGLEDVATKLVGSLSSGATYEKYTALKDLLKWGRQDQTGKVLTLAETVATSSGTIDYEKTLVALKNAVSGMQFVNTSFNTAGIKRATKNEDIVILMPYKLKNKIDVEELSGVFNLDKAELKNHIIEIDADAESISGTSFYTIYIVDKNAILSYTRLFEMATQLNADGLFWNYFLHVERLFGISPLFDGCYIRVNA